MVFKTNSGQMADTSLVLGHNSPSGIVVLKSVDCPGAPKVGLLDEGELGVGPTAVAER